MDNNNLPNLPPEGDLDNLQNYQDELIEKKRNLAVSFLLKGKSIDFISKTLVLEEKDVKLIFNSWYKEQLGVQDIFFTTKHLILLFVAILTSASMVSIGESLAHFTALPFLGYLLGVCICLTPILLIIHPINEVMFDEYGIEIEEKGKVFFAISVFILVFMIEISCNALTTNFMLSGEQKKGVLTNLNEVVGLQKTVASWFFGIVLPLLAVLLEIIALRYKNDKNLILIKKK